MLKIKAQNFTTKKTKTTSSASVPTHQVRQISLVSKKAVAPVFLKAFTHMNVLSKPVQMSNMMRTFCEDMNNGFDGRGSRFGRERRQPREGFQRRPPRDASHVIVIRGLGEGRETEAEVRKMFPGADIIPDGVKILKDSRGKSLNAVFVEFATVEESTRALDAYREGQRNVERDPDTPALSVRTSSPEEREGALSASSTPSTYVLVKRLPYSATDDEVKNVFSGFNVTGVTVGNGSAVVKFASADDAARALEKNGAEFARRQVVVAPGLEMDYNFSIARPPKLIRVRGAPSSATEQDYRKFFDGLEITRFNATSREGIAGRIVPGDVFIEFATPEDAAKALQMDRQNMGDRYLQIYRSAARERASRLNPQGGRGPNRGGSFGGFGMQEQQQ